MKRVEVLKPACFDHFSCKGGDCRYTCCYGWEISFDKADMETLKKKAKASDCIYELLDKDRRQDGNIYAISLCENGFCPYLTEKRWCGIQKKHGVDVMPAVCREFPRVYHTYLNKRELGLSLGCEKVLELLYEEKEGLEFSNKLEKIPDYQRTTSKVDGKKRLKYPALTYYYDIQSLCLSLLQAKDAHLEDRMILLGMALFKIDAMEKDGTHARIPAYINEFLNEMDAVDAASMIKEIKQENPGLLYSNIHTALQFRKSENGVDLHAEHLIEKIIEKLEVRSVTTGEGEASSTAEIILECSAENYHSRQNTFHCFIKDREYFLENIMVAFMFHLNMPFHEPKQGVWKNYMYFIWVYTMIKFALTMTLDEKSTTEDMIECCAVMFRKLGHDTGLYNHIIRSLEENQCDSVAHMAIFLKS